MIEAMTLLAFAWALRAMSDITLHGGLFWGSVAFALLVFLVFVLPEGRSPPA